MREGARESGERERAGGERKKKEDDRDSDMEKINEIFYLQVPRNSMKVIITGRERFSNREKGATYLKSLGKGGIRKSVRK